MATEIYVISGFLGAGKTTLIQKLLKESFRNERVVLIENDFGEISVDAALLQSGNIQVKEINSGCICCSLAGNFVQAVKEILDRFHPDKIMIEPSGIGKLSDIAKACSDRRIQPLVTVKAKIAVVDVKRCKMHLDNFGEFFEDQIQNANVILLSRTGDFPDKIKDACQLLKSLNAQAAILSKPWDQLDAAEILYPQDDRRGQADHCSQEQGRELKHPIAHDRGEQDHGHAHAHIAHTHNHAAEDVFDTVTIRTKRIFSIEELQARVAKMERGAKGTVLRAKGIVRCESGYVNLQYLPGDIRISKCTTSGDMLCIIGRKLNRRELVSLFSEE
jgi:G3E family GTPase